MRHAEQIFGTLMASVLAMLLVACSTNSYPPAPATVSQAEHKYVIGPLDTVNIVVWRNPELSGVFQVRPDGRISAPLVEDLPALGKNPEQLARDVEKALSKFLRDPVVTVIVSNFNGPTSEQIRVIGEATKPQILPFRRNMSLLDVMIAVGGLTPFADGNKASIYRIADGGKSYSVRLYDLINRGDITANVDMRPGDILIIPQSWF